MSAERTTGRVEVRGAAVEWGAWGSAACPTLLLVHGGAAHRGWWAPLLPALLPTFRVVAFDLSGHGRSDHRAAYDFAVWAEEVEAVAEAAAATCPVVVGHSMGGVIAAVVAARAEVDAIGGVVMVDTPLHAPTQATIGNAEEVFQRVRPYPSREAALERFRLLPSQPVRDPAWLTTLAAESVREAEDGWVWRFDPSVFTTSATDRPPDVGAVLAEVACPVGAIVAGRSPVVPPEDRNRLRGLAARAATPTNLYLEVPAGHHHLMFDRPDELGDGLERIARAWSLLRRDRRGRGSRRTSRASTGRST
jgi:pimeloyl-ACP methyl ester carboxylesterase